MHMKNLQNIRCQNINNRRFHEFVFINLISLYFYITNLYISIIIDKDMNILWKIYLEMELRLLNILKY